MKITLENTQEGRFHKKRKVIIETEHDDLNIDEVYEDIIFPALQAYGFTEQTVRGYVFPEDYECDDCKKAAQAKKEAEPRTVVVNDEVSYDTDEL